MNPSAKAIERAVEALKATPVKFQRLVEDVAVATWPQIFQRISPIGRRSDDVADPRWPDAIGLSSDDRPIILEATHSERWKEHLIADVEKAESYSQSIGAFVFVAWARTPKSEMLEVRARLERLGLTTDRVLFVFREELLRYLTQPRCARIWVDILGLPATAAPFDWLERATHLFGAEGSVGAFAPSRSEYSKGRVFRPSIADETESLLERRGWAFVRGRGAAGKTVLALSVALGATYGNRPSYYLDLTDLTNDNAEDDAALNAIATRGDEGVLFILDNVHLAERATRRIFEGWRSLADTGSKLLLLGRFATPEPDHRGTVNPLHDLDREALELRVDKRALLGVVSRLARRSTRANAVPDPPDQVLDEWLAIFGGDLLAFSAATALRMTELQQGLWHLDAADARGYVAREYFERASEGEILALTRLSVLARLEVPASSAVLGSWSSSSLLSRGLVLRKEHRAERLVRFRLVHPGIGRLLLAALPSVDHENILVSVAGADSTVGVLVGRRLALAGQRELARRVLRAVFDSASWFSLAFAPQNLRTLTSFLSDLEVVDPVEFSNRLLPYSLQLAEQASRLPVPGLIGYLRFAKEMLREGGADLYRAAYEQMATSGFQQRMLRSSAGGQLSSLPGFLLFIRRQGVAEEEGIYQSILDLLRQPELRAVVISNALRASLNDLVLFLRFARNIAARGGPDLFLPVLDALTAREHEDLLEEKLNNIHFQTLSGFIRHACEIAEDGVPDLFGRICEILLRPGNLRRFLERSLASDPLVLLNLIRTLHGSRGGQGVMLAQPVLRALNDQEWRARFVARVVAASPTKVLVILRLSRDLFGDGEGGIYREIWSALEEERYQEQLVYASLSAGLNELATFLRLAREISLGGRSSIYDSLAILLASQEWQEGLLSKALESTPNDLATFLRALGESSESEDSILVHAFDSLTERLAMAENRARLGRCAMRSSLNDLATLYRLVAEGARSLGDALVDALADQAVAPELAVRMAQAPLNELGAILEQRKLGEVGLAAVDLEEWRDTWSHRTVSGVDALPVVVLGLSRLGRPELMRAPAARVIELALPWDWHRPGVGLTAFSHAIRAAGEIERGALERFWDRIGTPSWLSQGYRRLFAGALAGSLFALYISLPSEMVVRMRTMSLRREIERKLRRGLVDERVSIADLVSLIGAGALIGLRYPQVWLMRKTASVAPVVSTPGPVREASRTGARQLQLWVGMREIAFLGRDSIAVDPEIGGSALAQLKEMSVERPILRELQEKIVVWLQASRDAGWVLPRGEEPWD